MITTIRRYFDYFVDSTHYYCFNFFPFMLFIYPNHYCNCYCLPDPTNPFYCFADSSYYFDFLNPIHSIHDEDWFDRLVNYSPIALSFSFF